VVKEPNTGRHADLLLGPRRRLQAERARDLRLGRVAGDGGESGHDGEDVVDDEKKWGKRKKLGKRKVKVKVEV